MRAAAELDRREQSRLDCPMGALANDTLTTKALAHTGKRGRNGPTIPTNPVADERTENSTAPTIRLTGPRPTNAMFRRRAARGSGWTDC